MEGVLSEGVLSAHRKEEEGKEEIIGHILATSEAAHCK